MEEFGALIRSAREKKHLTQYEAAALLGRPHTFLARIETGRNSNPPDPKTFDDLWRTLGVSKRSMLEALGYLDPEVPDAGVAYVIHDGDPRVAILDLLADETDEGIGTVAQIVGLLNLHSRAGAGVEESSKPNRDQSNTG